MKRISCNITGSFLLCCPPCPQELSQLLAGAGAITAASEQQRSPRPPRPLWRRIRPEVLQAPQTRRPRRRHTRPSRPTQRKGGAWIFGCGSAAPWPPPSALPQPGRAAAAAGLQPSPSPPAASGALAGEPAAALVASGKRGVLPTRTPPTRAGAT